MSDELRRALADAAGTPPPVDDWLTPVHRGVRVRRRRKALQQAGAGTALVVAAGLFGAGLLPGREADVLLPPPATSPRPSASTPAVAEPTATTSPSPSATPRAGLPVRPSPTGGPAVLPRLTPRAGSPAAPPAGLPRASATPAPSASSAPPAQTPAPSRPAAAPTRSPSPAPTAGAQEVEVTVSPPGRTFPAGEQVVVTVTATGSAERPPDVLALRIDGEPVEDDAPRACDRPSTAPPRSAQRAERRFTVVLSPGEHVLEAVADDGCSWYRGRGRVSYTVTAS